MPVARVKLTNRSPTFYLRSSKPRPSQLVSTAQKTGTLMIPKLGPNEEIQGPLELITIGNDEFNAERSHYLNAAIAPAGAQIVFGVVAGGRLIGCIAFTTQSSAASFAIPSPTVYMLTDFAIAPTRYSRLSKLVVAAAISRECRLLLERRCGRRFRSLVTTAFSDHPVSMKYRGVLKLLTRTETKGDAHPYKLNYGEAFGESTLADTFARWEAKSNANKSPHG